MSYCVWNQLESDAKVASAMTELYNRGLTTTSGGNVSVRDSDGAVWMTPSGVDKCRVRPDQVCKILPDGSRVGSYKPTSEWMMHCKIYEERKSIGAIVHTHSPSLLAFALSHTLPSINLFPLFHIYLGDVAFVPYFVCGSDKLAEACSKVVREQVSANCFILQNHGVIVVGDDIENAFNRLELLEKIASLCVRFPRQLSLSTPFLQTLGFYNSSDAHYDLNYQNYYEQIEFYSKRAYEHHLVSCEHLLSLRDEENCGLIHSNRIGCCPVLWKNASVTSKGPDGRLMLHQAIYTAFPNIKCIFDCSPRFTSLLLLKGDSIDSSIMPESLVVIGTVKHLPKEHFNIDNVVQLLKSGCDILLIEGYGVVVTGISPIQVYDRLEVLEATSEAIFWCQASGQRVCGLSEQEVNEVHSIFGFYNRGNVAVLGDVISVMMTELLKGNVLSSDKEHFFSLPSYKTLSSRFPEYQYDACLSDSKRISLEEKESWTGSSCSKFPINDNCKSDNQDSKVTGDEPFISEHKVDSVLLPEDSWRSGYNVKVPPELNRIVIDWGDVKQVLYRHSYVPHTIYNSHQRKKRIRNTISKIEKDFIHDTYEAYKGNCNAREIADIIVSIYNGCGSQFLARVKEMFPNSKVPDNPVATKAEQIYLCIYNNYIRSKKSL